MKERTLQPGIDARWNKIREAEMLDVTSRVMEFTLNPKSDVGLNQSHESDTPNASPMPSPTTPPASRRRLSNSQPMTPARSTSSLEVTGNTGDNTGSASLPDADTPPIYSDSESIIVQNNLHQDGFMSDNILPDPFYATLSLNSSPAKSQQIPDQPSDEGGLGGVVFSRKRSAKAASLPDSVTDSERGYGGFKSKDSSSSPSTPSSKHSHQRSFIPRPRPKSSLSQGQSQTDPSKIPLPRDSAPVLQADFSRFENDISPFSGDDKENLVPRMLKRTHGSPDMFSLATPSQSSLFIRDPDSQDQNDLEKLSTVAMSGSPCDLTGLPSDLGKVSATGSPGELGGARLVQPPPRTRGISTDDNHAVDDSNKPRLIFSAGRFYISAPSNTEPATYQASITVSVPLQVGKPGWWELIVPGLPRLAPGDHGYVYFQTPRGQGLQFSTTQFKRHSIVEGCLMAQMLISSRLTLPLRSCKANFFGYLKDFEVVVQAIQGEVQTADNNDASFRLVRYHATCSINLLLWDFWARECGFNVYIHGGPNGRFFCGAENGDFRKIHLETTGLEAGVTKLEVMGRRSCLESFTITWEMNLAKESPRLTPWISASPRALDDELQNDDAQMEALDQLEAVQVEARCQEPYHAYRLPLRQSTPSPRSLSSSRSFWKKQRSDITIATICFLFSGLSLYINWPILKTFSVEKQVPEIWYRENDPATVHPVQPQLEVIPKDDGFDMGAWLEEFVTKPALEGSDVAWNEMREKISVPEGWDENVNVNVNENENESDTRKLTLRDRVDYFLGWGGPIEAL